MFKGDSGSHKRAGVRGLILSLAARRICAGTVVAIPEFTGMRCQVEAASVQVFVDLAEAATIHKGEREWPRHEFLYWTDDGNVAALRYNQWKITFLRQNAHSMEVWVRPLEALRAPLVENLL